MQLRDAMSAHDANLAWAARVRRTDLAALVAQTSARLDAATSAAEARSAFEAFLTKMGDGHLEIDWPQPDSTPAPVPDLCGRLGYRERRLSPGLQFQMLPASRATRSRRYFPTSVLELPDGSAIGIIRIGVFSSKWYPELCAGALPGLHLTATSACDDDCSDRVELAAENELTKQLTAALVALEGTPRLRLLAVDLTRNGGGTDWEEPAARELTPVRLRSPRMGFVKHEHWERSFTQALDAIRGDLPHATSGYRELLLRAQGTYTQLLAESRQHCDQDALWLDDSIPCSIVGEGALYTTGTLAYAAPGALPGNDRSAAYLFLPSTYVYREGVYRGPLAVLVDGNTASAGERFAAVFQDNKAARIVGLPTFGAGCGYTNGGIPTQLTNSGATVMMPDCVQFRADGTNAVGGITPDVLVPWRPNDSDFQRAERAFEALRALAPAQGRG